MLTVPVMAFLVMIQFIVLVRKLIKRLNKLPTQGIGIVSKINML